MKTKFITIALIAIMCITSQLVAQQSAAKSTGYDLKKNVKCRVSTTETGYSIVFEYEVKAPKDVATGQASGKRGYDYYNAQSEYSVSVIDNAVYEVKSPRDAASGLPTGKRQHKPVTFIKELDKSSPKLAEAVTSSKVNTDATSTSVSGGGAGKVSLSSFNFMKRCGDVSTKYTLVDGECVIPTDDCPNGVCILTTEWSWGASNTGSSSMGSTGTGSGRSSVDYFLNIEGGACTAMAINEKGLPVKKKHN